MSHRLPIAAATGLGSMPFTDPDEALARVARFFPEIPYWPQLPRKNAAEGLVLQVLHFFEETGLIRIDGDRAVFLTRRPDWPERLTDAYTTLMAAEAGESAALDRFGLHPDSASGFFRFLEVFHETAPGAAWIKGQVAGPLTVGFQVTDQDGRMAFYDDTLRDILLQSIALHARWQCRKLAALGRPVILFVDDPSIAAFGKYNHITLEREAIMAAIEPIFTAIHGEQAAAGLHSCDGADWTLVTESSADILSLDAYQFGHTLSVYADHCRRFIRRGGTIAWGIVPTMAAADDETVQGLLDRLITLCETLSDETVPAKQFLQQGLVTPACGTGLLSPDLADTIFTLTAGVSEAVRRFVAAR
ncbi:MAG: hypothetical protein ABIL58_07500 [Pseudomonadota bacterium]